MQKSDILEVRCLIARIAAVPPDNIEVIIIGEDNNLVLFDIPCKIYNKEWDLVVAFNERPEQEEIKEQVNFLIDAAYEQHKDEGL